MHRLVLGVVVRRVGVVDGDVDGADVVEHVVRQLLQRLRCTDLLFSDQGIDTQISKAIDVCD
jgi:hypothetical protein